MATGFRLIYKVGDWADAMKSIEGPIADAATNAMREAATIIKAEGRANIRAAGFGPKWANALRVNVYPSPPKSSMGVAAYIYHKISYAGVFEEGPTTVRGKPLLWIPLSTTPKKVGGKRMTPAQYIRTIGPLISIQRPGENPLLAGSIATNRRGQRASTKNKVTLSALRRAGQGVATRLVPLFVGVPQVVLQDRFSIFQITERAADRLAELYLKHLNPDG